MTGINLLTVVLERCAAMGDKSPRNKEKKKQKKGK